MSKRTISIEQPAYRCLALALVFTLSPTGVLAETASAQDEAGLLQLLEQQGWQTKSGPDGSLLFRPAAPITRQTGEATQSDSLPAAAAPEIEHLLLQRGWRIATDASGNTILQPAQTGGQGSQSGENVTGEIPTGSAATAAGADPFAQFKRSLSEKGWRVESAPDGSLMVFPPLPTDALQTAGTFSKAQRGHCEGVSLAAVEQQEISLPIDNPAQAARLATDWIANFGHAEDTVGRIREINRVYAVSIVDKSPPHHLRNQLIIRRENGGIIAID